MADSSTRHNLYFVGSFTNALAMRFGTRIVAFIGGIVLSIGYISSMFATKIEHLYLTYGLTAGNCNYKTNV